MRPRHVLRWHRRLAGARSAPRLTVLVRTLDQLDAVLAWSPPDGLPRPAAVYCDFEDLRRYTDAVPRARAAGVPIGLAPLRVLKPGEDGFQSPIVRAEPGHRARPQPRVDLATSASTCRTRRSIGDFSLNVANELTADLLIRDGPRTPRAELRPELGAARGDGAAARHPAGSSRSSTSTCRCSTWSTASSRRSSRPARTTATAAGRATGTRSSCATASGPTSRSLPDTGCRNTVFNACRRAAAEYVGRMRRTGAAALPRRSAARDAGASRAAAGPLRPSGRRTGRRPHGLERIAGVESAGGHSRLSSDALGVSELERQSSTRQQAALDHLRCGVRPGQIGQGGGR